MQIGTEFADQLGVPDSAGNRDYYSEVSASAPYRVPPMGEVIASFIDEEASGKKEFLRSADIASKINKAIVDRVHPFVFIVLAPRFGCAWELENEHFLRIFAAMMARGRSCIFVLAVDNEVTPPSTFEINWKFLDHADSCSQIENLTQLIPSTFSEEITKSIGSYDESAMAHSLIALQNNYFLVPPEKRVPISLISEKWYDILGARTSKFGWLHAYALFHGHQTKNNPWELVQAGQEMLSDGSPGIALRFAKKTIDYPGGDAIRWILKSIAAGLHLAAGSFAEVDRWEISFKDIPRTYRGFLLIAKGWAKVMMGKCLEAEALLAEARDLYSTEPFDHALYPWLLNVSALNYLKLGNMSRAMTIEKEIEKTNETTENKSWQLEYVNCLNIARLHRMGREFSSAEKYYLRAFATDMGARSAAELVYINSCLARLYDEKGDLRKAFRHWLRAGIHWLSCCNQEAMPDRFVLSITGRKKALSLEKGTHSISTVLSERISEHQVFKNMQVSAGDYQETPSFVRSSLDGLLPLNSEKSLGLFHDGIGIFATSSRIAKVRRESDEELGAIICKFLTSPNENKLRGYQTFVVDDQLGREIPETLLEFFAVSRRLNVEKILLDGTLLHPSADQLFNLDLKSTIALSEIVNSVSLTESLGRVKFKRILHEKRLRPEETKIVEILNESKQFNEIRSQLGKSFEVTSELLRALERDRVITYSLGRSDLEPIIGRMAPS
jgi:tetratricopeptide (TPR) repeat protein